MIKAIAFDLGGVLMKEKDLDLNGPADVIERKFGKINFDKEFYNWAVKETGVSLSKVKSIINDIMLNHYELRDPHIFSKLPHLKLAIASNHLSGIRLWLNKLDTKFHTVVISAECGYEKPKKEFYKYLIKKLDEKPENILFVDDRIENILGAKKVGLQTLHFKNKGDLYKEISLYLKNNLVENYLLEIQVPKGYQLIIQKNNLSAPIFKRRPHLARDLYGKFCENKPCRLITYSLVYNNECIGAMVIIEKPEAKQTKGYKVDVMMVFLHVDSDHRGKNLGGILVKDVISKYKKIFLTTDKRSSDVAKAMYERYGFKIIGKETKTLWHWIKGI